MEPIKIVILDGGVPWEVVEVLFDDRIVLQVVL